MLAEQSSYGITQIAHGVKNELDSFWFLSNPGDGSQPWSSAMGWDPCEARAAPPLTLPMPPLWHACSTYDIPNERGFRLHKDHVHKDLLDCDAPLIRYPPTSALSTRRGRQPIDVQNTWAVCAYTNLVNAYAAAYKKRFCAAPNLNALAQYPGGAQGFLNPDSRLKKIFRKGGWTDVDYKVGREKR